MQARSQACDGSFPSRQVFHLGLEQPRVTSAASREIGDERGPPDLLILVSFRTCGHQYDPLAIAAAGQQQQSAWRQPAELLRNLVEKT